MPCRAFFMPLASRSGKMAGEGGCSQRLQFGVVGGVACSCGMIPTAGDARGVGEVAPPAVGVGSGGSGDPEAAEQSPQVSAVAAPAPVKSRHTGSSLIGRRDPQ